MRATWGINGAIAIGAYIGLVSVWAAPVSGASMNPARSLGPELVGWDLTNSWIYLVGPIIGAMVAVGFEWILKGKATTAGAEAAQASSMRTPKVSDPTPEDPPASPMRRRIRPPPPPPSQGSGGWPAKNTDAATPPRIATPPTMIVIATTRPAKVTG